MVALGPVPARGGGAGNEADHDDDHGRDDGGDALDAQVAVLGVRRRVETQPEALQPDVGR